LVGSAASRDQHADVVPVQQRLVQFGRFLSLRRSLVFRYVFQDHIDEIIEPEQRSAELAVVLHDDPDLRTDTPIDKL